MPLGTAQSICAKMPLPVSDSSSEAGELYRSAKERSPGLPWGRVPCSLLLFCFLVSITHFTMENPQEWLK